MHSPRLLSALALAAACGLALVATVAATHTGAALADPLRFDADTGDAQAHAPTTAWPDRVVVDASTWTLLALWTTDPPREQTIPMSSIATFERARAWEGRPDELVAVLKDHSRVMMARGPNVTAAATLITAVVGRQVAEVDPAGDWQKAKRQDGRSPDTALALGSVHTAAGVASALQGNTSSGTGTWVQVERRSLLYDETVLLPDHADADALGAAEIRIAVQQQMNPIRQCYNRELQRNGSLAGRIVVWFIIDVDGRVSEARLKDSTMANVVVEDCIVAEVEGMRFPKPQAGKVVPVSFPFTFTGSGQ